VKYRVLYTIKDFVFLISKKKKLFSHFVSHFCYVNGYLSRYSINCLTVSSAFLLVKTACERIKKPITCKIRVYESIEKTVAYAKRLERAGAKVTISFSLLFLCEERGGGSESF